MKTTKKCIHCNHDIEIDRCTNFECHFYNRRIKETTFTLNKFMNVIEVEREVATEEEQRFLNKYFA